MIPAGTYVRITGEEVLQKLYRRIGIVTFASKSNLGNPLVGIKLIGEGGEYVVLESDVTILPNQSGKPIVTFDTLKKLIEKVQSDPTFDGNADVFISSDYSGDCISITWGNKFGYSAYFLNLTTGEIDYGD